MYAIINVGGKQVKVQKDQFVYVNRLEGNEGDSVTFDDVLLLSEDGDVTVGAPTVSGASVSGKVLAQVKSDKVVVFKKKRRKGYAVRNGHRQQLTKVLIEDIKK